MPAYTQPSAGLVVTFHRDDEEVDHATAPTGERALKAALLMLAKQDFLQDGDVLRCVADDVDGKPLPPPRSRPKQ